MSKTELAPRSKAKQQQGLRELMDRWAQDPAYIYLPLTLTLNTHVSPEAGEALLKRFDAFLNRDVIGRNWLKKPDERVVWFALPEKWSKDENPHYHLVVRVKPEQVIPVHKAVRASWKAQIASGTVDLVVSPEGEDWIGYITKKWSSLDAYVYSLQFKTTQVGAVTS